MLDEELANLADQPTNVYWGVHNLLRDIYPRSIRPYQIQRLLPEYTTARVTKQRVNMILTRLERDKLAVRRRVSHECTYWRMTREGMRNTRACPRCGARLKTLEDGSVRCTRSRVVCPYTEDAPLKDEVPFDKKSVAEQGLEWADSSFFLPCEDFEDPT